VTAGLAQEVGITSVVDAAHRCGISSPLAPNASLALGTSDVTPIELTTAYAVFASGGERVSSYLVTAVEDNAHRTLYQRKPAAPDRVIASHVDRDLTGMLYGVIVEGTGRAAALPGREAAGKTGTTQDYRDAWFVGFTPDYVAGVWIGNDDNAPMRNVTGGTLPAAIWKEVMTAAEHGLPARALDKSTEPPPEEEVSDTESASIPDDETSADSSTASNDSSMRESGTRNGDEAAKDQQAPAAQGGSSSFWDWLTGNSHDKPQERPHSSDESMNEPPHHDASAETPPRRSVPEGRVESVPSEGPDITDTPPVRDPDDNAGPPPPAELMHRDERPPPPPDEHSADPPPAIVLHHRERLPPPPPPDDNGDGN
jgi:penicillin-binding protein 1A